MFNEYDVVMAVRSLNRNVPAGTTGTVLVVYQKPRVAFEVEFTDDSGRSLDVLTVEEDDIEMVNPGGLK